MIAQVRGHASQIRGTAGNRRGLLVAADPPCGTTVGTPPGDLWNPAVIFSQLEVRSQLATCAFCRGVSAASVHRLTDRRDISRSSYSAAA